MAPRSNDFGRATLVSGAPAGAVAATSSAAEGWTGGALCAIPATAPRKAMHANRFQSIGPSLLFVWVDFRKTEKCMPFVAACKCLANRNFPYDHRENVGSTV